MNVRTLCLGVLSFGDASGYEIKKMAEDGLFSHFIEASFGSIYPALTKMTDEGLLTCREEAQSGKPDKKVYSITNDGMEELKQALTTTPSKDKFKSEFLFIMLLSGLLDRDHVRGLLVQRTEELIAELKMIETCAANINGPGTKFVNGYGRAVVGAAAEYLLTQKDFEPALSPESDGGTPDCVSTDWQASPQVDAAE